MAYTRGTTALLFTKQPVSHDSRTDNRLTTLGCEGFRNSELVYETSTRFPGNANDEGVTTY